MGRYRPPRARGSAYITPEGEATLRAEVHQLWKVERPTVTATVHEAAKNGDRSENGDYIYGKRRLREIDSRVRFLNKRLEELDVVDRLPSSTDKVYFGAWVTLENEAGETVHYRIVGPDEFDLRQQKLSMDSPLAKAIMGKRVDDEAVVQSPEGPVYWSIVAISYVAPD
ncbi:transcription elongation factor GreB [Halieaceae bacterium IMCC14734]|uniref:Transcription elongation factor GreB n=1 Tax=Candidatus Litorirhabdus singularis TaxID=2518993 RepID=A0ABT3TGK4_9GAMM|nr:transcription elongation factor GreB [Candidatus Litorirhabdus singularis]MCX2980896.1 transcription elongation factor GreB [Candidatus Litorirhabdus singularis]